jgi:hypothetical protein
MRPLAFLFLLAAAGAAAACGNDERTAREELAVTASEDPGYRTDEPAAVTPVPGRAGDGTTLTGNLAEMGNSGASGVVTLTPQNGQTLIQLSVTGVQPDAELRPTIHRGGCAEAGRLAHELERIRVEGTGLAIGNITVPLAVRAIADGLHSVRIYSEAGLQAPPLACADIPPAAAQEDPM